VVAAPEPPHDVATHSAKADHADFHVILLVETVRYRTNLSRRLSFRHSML
jgi:hypothetical protein